MAGIAPHSPPGRNVENSPSPENGFHPSNHGNGAPRTDPSRPELVPRPEQGPRFDSALRGYDRRQVDDAVGERDRRLAGLEAELSEAQRLRRLADDHARATEEELRDLHARFERSGSRPAEEGFGYRAEKLLRLAEQEATEAREQASRDAAALVERARSEAEEHRHEVERTLIARSGLMEQQAAQRSAELQDREQQISDQLAAARQQADELHAGASEAAQRVRQEAETAAAEVRRRAEAAAARQQEQAKQELARLTTLQSDVRAELARLMQLLTTELGTTTGNGVPHQRSEGPKARSAAAATSGSSS